MQTLIEKYMERLFRQYCESTGEQLKWTSNSEKEFLKWIYKNVETVEQYADFLQSLGYYDDVPDEDMAEVGKGRFDTIVTGNMKMFSEFAETNNQKNSKLIIDGGQESSSESVSLIVDDKIIVPEESIFLTHNPYDLKILKDWYVLATGPKKISVGVYGNVDDANAKTKVKTLERFAKRLPGDYVVDSAIDGDKYFYTINSPKARRDVKTMHYERNDKYKNQTMQTSPIFDPYIGMEDIYPFEDNYGYRLTR